MIPRTAPTAATTATTSMTPLSVRSAARWPRLTLKTVVYMRIGKQTAAGRARVTERGGSEQGKDWRACWGEVLEGPPACLLIPARGDCQQGLLHGGRHPAHLRLLPPTCGPEHQRPHQPHDLGKEGPAGGGGGLQRG